MRVNWDELLCFPGDTHLSVLLEARVQYVWRMSECEDESLVLSHYVWSWDVWVMLLHRGGGRLSEYVRHQYSWVGTVERERCIPGTVEEDPKAGLSRSASTQPDRIGRRTLNHSIPS